MWVWYGSESVIRVSILTQYPNFAEVQMTALIPFMRIEGYFCLVVLNEEADMKGTIVDAMGKEVDVLLRQEKTDKRMHATFTVHDGGQMLAWGPIPLRKKIKTYKRKI